MAFSGDYAESTITNPATSLTWYNTSGHVAGVSRQLRVAELRVMGK